MSSNDTTETSNNETNGETIEECVICLEELAKNEEWGRCTPCNHAFHKKCWWQWENSHHERVDRSRRQGNDTQDEGPKCCLCNTVAQGFVDGKGEPAHNPEPFVADEDGEDRKSFFDWLFRRVRGDGGTNNQESTARGTQNQAPNAANVPNDLNGAVEFLERMAQQGGSVMGMDAAVLLDQLRFGGGGFNFGPPAGGAAAAGANNPPAGNRPNFDFGRLFQEWGPGGAGPFGLGARSNNTNNANNVRREGSVRSEGSFGQIRQGTPVVIQDLVSSPHLNGQRAKITQFDRQSGRYAVALDSNNVTVALKSENIIQIVTVKILGLVSQPQFNGREGTIVSYNKERNRYVVRVADPSETKDLSIKSANIRIPDLTKVRLEGLENQPQWNGRYGTILKWENGRYQVRLSNMYSVRVKVENVRL